MNRHKPAGPTRRKKGKAPAPTKTQGAFNTAKDAKCIPDSVRAASSLIDLVHGALVTDSVKVAKRFGKRHDNVLRSIRELECSQHFRLLNFEESSYVNAQGKPQPMVTMTKDGFLILAMGFTGAAAAAWRERFIETFNLMADVLSRRQLADVTSKNMASIGSGLMLGRRRYLKMRPTERELLDCPLQLEIFRGGLAC